MVTQGSFYEMGFLYKLFICLLQNSAMGLYFKMLIIHEGTTEGLQWHNIFKPVTSRDDFTIGYTWIMMFFHTLLYLAIALYVEKMMPNDAADREQWLSFIFKNIFMKKFVQIDDKESVESKSGDQNVGIEIKNLRKIYDNSVVAVDGLTMNAYKDQITILLGYKGAGKTTVLSMLAGGYGFVSNKFFLLI
jgi:ATP-binding cassette subfamily A (ABC1) protein 3